MGGTVSGYNYFLSSDTLEDEISVTRDPKGLLELDYANGGELGNENNEIIVGEWSEFELKLKNTNDSEEDRWDNIRIRGKFFGVSDENVSLSFRENGKWHRCSTYDLRLLNLNENGTGVDIRPENNWRINPSNNESLKIRLKIEQLVENINLQFQAFTSSEKDYGMFPSLRGDKSKKIIYPVKDSYKGPNSTVEMNSDEDHLEIGTVENGNRYSLLSFEIDNVPENAESASLNVHQYWGSNFSTLRERGIKIELFSIDNSEEVEGGENGEILGEKIDEKTILGEGKWYSFEILEYLRNKSLTGKIDLVLKLGTKNFENTSRIRFYSKEGKHSPSIIFE